MPASAATWEPAGKLPAEFLAAHVSESRAAFNRKFEPLLAQPVEQMDSSGVQTLSVPADAAARCAHHLQEWWRDGKLPLRNGTVSCQGYAQYGKTLDAHDAEQQSKTTLLMNKSLLPLLRQELPGFAEMEDFLVGWLHTQHGIVVDLYFCHCLRQSPYTLKSTGFDVHQDTEDFPFINFTVVVKLTPDGSGEAQSKMRVVGAGRHFEYAAPAGSAGAFRARLFHASVEPEEGTEEHLKVGFFFCASDKGERRAKRALAADGISGDEEALSQKRRLVANELASSTLSSLSQARERTS